VALRENQVVGAVAEANRRNAMQAGRLRRPVPDRVEPIADIAVVLRVSSDGLSSQAVDAVEAPAGFGLRIRDSMVWIWAFRRRAWHRLTRSAC
jgi:hypothetical protein